MSPEPRPHGRLLARNSLLNLLGLGAPMAVALVAVPLLVDGLGTERFGVLTLAWIFLTYLGELGFGSTTTRFTAEALGAGRVGGLGGIVWTTAGMQGGLGALVGAALAMATPWLVESAFQVPAALTADASMCLYLLAAVLPVLGVAKSFRGVLEAGQRFDLITAVRIPATSANYLLPVAGVALGWGLAAIFALIIVSRIASLLAYAVLAVRTFPEVSWRPQLDRDGWKRMLGFGGWVTLSSVASPLIVYLDRFFVGVLLSMSAVAYYAAPYELVARLTLIPMSVVGTLYPAFSHLGGAGQRERNGVLAARSIKAILLMISPVVLLLLGASHEALRLWLGEAFARESGLALQILAVGVFVSAAAHVPYALLQGTGRPDIPARFHLLELPFQAVLAWLLVSTMGIPGAALAWTGRVVFDAALLFAASHRLGVLPLSELVRERVVRSAVVIALGGAAVLVSSAWARPLGERVGLVVLVVAAVGVVVWRHGMDASERMRIRSLLQPAQPA